MCEVICEQYSTVKESVVRNRTGLISCELGLPDDSFSKSMDLNSQVKNTTAILFSVHKSPITHHVSNFQTQQTGQNYQPSFPDNNLKIVYWGKNLLYRRQSKVILDYIRPIVNQPTRPTRPRDRS